MNGFCDTCTRAPRGCYDCPLADGTAGALALALTLLTLLAAICVAVSLMGGDA